MPTAPARSPAVDPAAATPMAFARAIAEAYRHHGKDPAEALRLAQIPPARLQQAHARITARQLEILSETAMRELDDEALGALSRRLPWGSYGMLARASLTSPTLGVALKRWCRHHGLLADDLALRVEVAGGTARVVVEERRPLPAGRREFFLVFVLRNMHGLACWYVDSRIPLQAARFPYPAPPHAEAYRHMFAGALEFDAPVAELRFDAQYLALPLCRDEQALQAMLQRALPLPLLQYRRDRLLVQQVRQVLRAHPADAQNAERLAGHLNISARTLHRQLAEQGFSLQRLKDEVRCEQARDLLYRTDKQVKQVAAACGFLNEKSFSRAFQKWTGSSPGQFRAARAR